MATGGYDPSLPPSNTFRRSSSSVPYDIGPHAQTHRASLSPVTSSRRTSMPYDSYGPSRVGPSHRDEFPNANNYRPDPNAWRPPARATSIYYSRSPSPNRYDHARLPESKPWDRPTSPISWMPASSSWRLPVQSPPFAPRDRPHRETMAQSMSQPLFEPSDTWKKSHDDRTARNELLAASSVTRISAPRPPLRRPPSPSRNDYTSHYYPKENNYRPPQSPVAPSYRDTYTFPRENNYRPQYDDRNPWGQQYSRGTSQLPSAGFRRDSVPSRNVSRDIGDRYSYRPPSPSPEHPLRGRLPRRESRSRSASRSPRYATRSKPRVQYNRYPQVYRGRPLTRSHTRSLSRSRSLTRSLSSSDVASTRASQRSSRERPKAPPLQPQQPPQDLSDKPREDVNLISTKPSTSESPLPVITPVVQAIAPTPKEAPVLPVDEQQYAIQPIAPKQEECVIGVPNQTDDAPVPTSKVNSPKLLSRQVGTAQPSGGFSSPLSSPDRPVQLEANVKRHIDDLDTQKILVSAKAPETSDVTTDDEDNLPNMSDARSIADALRIVVMTRLRCDRQTREERVNPVLMANRAIVQSYQPRPFTSAEELVREVTQGEQPDSRMKVFAATKASLATRFAIREEALSEKTERLREEYLALHERWQVHCTRLDNQSNKKTTKDTPAPADELVIPTTSGRSTRRTAAILGDAVRSDLEMEQIIASLGVEELTDPNHLALRNLANIPDMISVSHGEVAYSFDDTNNLVDNPERFYDPSAGADIWTDEEKEIFLEQFAANPKQFGIIASYLPAKTAAQCVAFYYLHKKKHVDFRKVVSLYAPGKRRRGGRRTDKQKGNALMADIRQHDDEVSLSHSGPTTRRKRAILPSTTKLVPSRLGASNLDFTPGSTPTPDPEPEARKRGRRPNTTARIISVSVDDTNENGAGVESKTVKRGRKGRKPKTSALIIEDSSTPTTVEGNNNESVSRRKTTTVNWSDEDKSLFLILLSQYGDDFKRIAASMPHKTTIQVNNYYKSNAADLELDKIVASAPKRSPTPETASDAWGESSRAPGSGRMTPVRGAAAIVADAPSYTDLDRQLPSNGHTSSLAALQKVRDILDQKAPSTSASASSGDLPKTLKRHSEFIESKLQLENTSDLVEHHRFQKPMQFTRFVSNGVTGPGPTGSPANGGIPIAPFSFSSYSSEPSYKTQQASQHVPIVFYEQNTSRPYTRRQRAGGEDFHRNSFSGSILQGPNPGSLPHITAQRGVAPEPLPQWGRFPNPPLSAENTTSQSDYFTPSGRIDASVRK